jgi:hypothetical protein
LFAHKHALDSHPAVAAASQTFIYLFAAIYEAAAQQGDYQRMWVLHHFPHQELGQACTLGQLAAEVHCLHTVAAAAAVAGRDRRASAATWKLKRHAQL